MAARLLLVAAVLAGASGQLPASPDFTPTATQATMHGGVSVANYHGVAASAAGYGYSWGAYGPWLGIGSSNQYSNTNCIAAPACGTTTPYAWDPKGYTKSLTTGIFAVKVVAVAAASEDTTLLINTNLPGGFATGNTGYSMTLLSNGRVMVMGKCGSGQCANGGTSNTDGVYTGSGGGNSGSARWQFDGGNTYQTTLAVMDLAGGPTHSCVVINTGAVKCSGSGSSGELGVAGITTQQNTPPASDLDYSLLKSQMNAPYNTWTIEGALVTCGNAFTCVLLNTGYVTCFGDNAYGQIGSPSSTIGTDVVKPTYVVSLNHEQALQISSGLQHACAVTAAGKAYCWGRNDVMQLASSAAPSATTASSTPVVVTLPGGRTAVQVACGARHTCVLMDNRLAVCAGYNYWGQLGNGGTTSPITNTGAGGTFGPTGGVVVSIQSGPTGYSTCFEKLDGGVSCYGHAFSVGTKTGANTKPQAIQTAQALTTAASATAGLSGYIPWPVVQAMRPRPAIDATLRPDDSWTTFSVNLWEPYDRSNGAAQPRLYFDDIPCTNSYFTGYGLNASTAICSMSDADLRKITRVPTVTMSWTGAPLASVFGISVCPRPAAVPQTVDGSSVGPTSVTITGVCLNTGTTPTATIVNRGTATVTASSLTSVTLSVPVRAGTQYITLTNPATPYTTTPTIVTVNWPTPVAQNLWTAAGRDSGVWAPPGETAVVFGLYFGPAGVGTVVTASFGDGRSSVGSVVNSTAASFAIPPFAGVFDMTVNIFIEGILAGSFVGAYPRPTVSGISPTTTYGAHGFTSKNFTITGTLFGSMQSDVKNVTIGGSQCTTWTRVSASTITCSMSQVAIQRIANGIVAVTLLGYEAAPLTANLVTFYGIPSITRMIAKSPADPLEPLWFDGTAMGYGAATVLNSTGMGLGNAPILGFQLYSATTGYINCSMVIFPTFLGQTLGCMPPATISSFYGVSFTARLQLEDNIVLLYSTPFQFSGTPTLATSITTTRGGNVIGSAGETVSLTGSSFGTAGWIVYVQVNGVNTTYTHSSNTLISTVVIPTFSAAGSLYTATVRVFTMGGYASNAATLTYEVPTITAVTPNRTYSMTGYTTKVFSISGTLFGLQQSDIGTVTIGGAACASPVRVNANNITCVFTAAQMGNIVSSGVSVALTGGITVSNPTAYTWMGLPKIDTVVVKAGDPSAPSVFLGSALGYGLSKLQTTNTTNHANNATIIYAGFIDNNGTRRPCGQIDFPYALGYSVICTPNTTLVTTQFNYNPYVLLEDNITVIGGSMTFASQTNTLVVAWGTADLAATALPSSTSVQFYTSPSLQVTAKTPSGSDPQSPVTCMLVLDTSSVPAGSSINPMLVGNTSVSLKGSSFSFPSGIMGRSNWNYTLTAQCSYGGLGPWFVTPTSIRVRVGALQARWNVGAANGTLTSGKVSRANPAGALTAISPSPTVSLWANFGSAWSLASLTPSSGSLNVPCVVAPYTTTTGEYVDKFGTATAQVDPAASTATYASLGVVGSLGVPYNLNASCSWVTGESIATVTSNSSRVAAVQATWITPPSNNFIYNTPTASTVLQISQFNPLTNTWVPLTAASLTSADVQCSITASTANGLIPVTFLGGTVGAFQPNNGTITVGPFSYLPVYQSIVGAVRVDTVVQCAFREQQLSALTFTTTMQNLTIGWTTQPPISLVSSSSTMDIYQPTVQFALNDQFGARITTDSSTTCTLSLASAVDTSGKSVRAAVAQVTTTTLVAGAGLFDRWTVTSPLQAAVQMRISCTRSQGGPSVTASFNATIQGAELTWQSAQSINSTYGRTLVVYDVASTVVARLLVRNTTSATNARQFSLDAYNSSYYPPAACNLVIDTSVAAGANALLSGDPLAYQSQPVSAAGLVTFNVRITANTGYAVPLKLNCIYGDASVSSSSVLNLEIAPMTAEWHPSLLPPNLYTFGTLTTGFALQFFAVVPANASKPAYQMVAALPGIVSSDFACSVSAALNGTNTTVSLVGGDQNGPMDIASAKMDRNGVSLSPDNPLPNTLVAVAATCFFRKNLAIPAINFVARQQTLSLQWLDSPPTFVSASTSQAGIFPQPPITLTVVDESFSILTRDDSQCSLAVVSAFVGVTPVSASIGGTSTAAAQDGTVAFSSWYVTAPISALVQISVTCRHKGPDMLAYANFTTVGAEVNWYSAATLKQNFSRPIFLYDTPNPITARIMVRQPQFNNGTSPYDLVPYDNTGGRQVYANTTCSLSIDPSTSGAASAILSGNPNSYSKQPVNATGFITFNVRLTATPEVQVFLRMTCAFGDNAITTPTLAVQLAYVVATWVRQPPPTFIYGTPTVSSIFQLWAKIPGNATLLTADELMPTSVASISATDLSCAMTVYSPFTGSGISFSGGNAGAVDPQTGTVQISGFAISPAVYAPGTTATIAGDCAFKKYMAVPRLSFNTTMQPLALTWVTPPPVSFMPASSTQQIFAPAITLALTNGTGGAMTFDSTTVCTLRVAAAVDRRGVALAQSSVVGTAKVTAAAGVVTFANWGVQSALGSLVNLTVTCSRAEGGIDLINTATVAMFDAAVSVASVTTIGTGGAAWFPTLVYDTPATLVMQMSLQRPTTATLNPAFAPVSYGAVTAQVTTCTLSVVTAQATVPVSINGQASGYQGVIANSTGFATLAFRIAAQPGVVLPFQVVCRMGDTILSAPQVNAVVAPLQLRVFSGTTGVGTYLPPPTNFIYNELLATSTFQLMAVINATNNVIIPLPSPAVFLQSDLSCSVDATSAATGTVRTVPLPGATITPLTTLDGTMQVRGALPQPPYAGVTGAIDCKVALSCSYRTLKATPASFTAYMQNLTLNWDVLPLATVARSTTSSPPRLFPLSAFTLSLRNMSNGVASNDNTGTCTLQADGSIDVNGKAGGAQSVVLGGTLSTRFTAGVASFTGITVNAPLLSVVYVTVTCSPGNGGPAVFARSSIAVHGARMQWGARQTLDTSNARVVAFYDTPSNITAFVQLLVPTTRTNGSIFSVNGFNAAAAPAPTCTLAIDAVRNTASASLGGDSRSYQSRVVDANGYVTFSVRLQAPSRTDIPLVLDCKLGDYALDQLTVNMRISSITASLLQSWPALAMPSSTTSLQPIAQTLRLKVADDYGTTMTDDSGAVCTMTALVYGLQLYNSTWRALTNDELANDVFPAKLQGPSSSAGGVALVAGIATYSSLAVSVEAGAKVTFTVTCRRTSGGDAAMLTANTTFSMFVVQYVTYPPVKVLYNTFAPVSTRLFYQTALGDDWQLRAFNVSTFTSATCALSVSDADVAEGITLGGGARVITRPVDQTGLSTFSLQLLGELGSTAHLNVRCEVLGSSIDISYQANSTIQALATRYVTPPPTRTLPTSGALTTIVTPYPAVVVTSITGEPVDNTGIRCTVGLPRGTNVTAYAYSPDEVNWPPRIRDAPDYYSYNAALDRVTIDQLHIAGWWNVTLPLQIACTRPQGDTIPVLPLPMHIPAVGMSWMAVPPSTVPAKAKMFMQLALEDLDYNVVDYSNNVTTCAATNDRNAPVQYSDAQSVNGIVTFPTFQLLGDIGSNYTVTISCRFGDVPYPVKLTTAILIAGCLPGEEPLGGSSCTPCGSNMYSDGGSLSCIKCPYGVDCTGGVLSIQEGFYLALTEAVLANPTAYNVTVLPGGRAIPLILPTTELHSCWTADSCAVNTTERSFGCAEGYTGVLCGVCDEDNDYVRNADQCVKCVNRGFNKLMLGGGLIVIMIVLVYVSLAMDFGSSSQGKIVWRIAVNYVSALAMFATYVTKGTATFVAATGWLQSLVAPGSGSGLEIAPIQCELKLSFYFRFTVTMNLPLMCGVFCIVVNILNIMRYKAREGWPAIVAEVKAFFTSQKGFAVLSIVLFMAYPALTKEAFKMFQCTAATIAGKHYLLADMRVSCDSAKHALGSTMAWVAIGLLVAGLPLLCTYYLYRNETSVRDGPASPFFSLMGFLYQGYKTDKWYLYSWEALVMVRKAFIVAIAATTKDPVYQCCCAVLLLVVSFGLQLHVAPYERALFNWLEAGTLMTLILTLTVSMMYLRASTLLTVSTSALYPETLVNTAKADLAASPGMLTETTTSGVLLAANIIMLAILIYFFVHVKLHETSGDKSCWYRFKHFFDCGAEAKPKDVGAKIEKLGGRLNPLSSTEPGKKSTKNLLSIGGDPAVPKRVTQNPLAASKKKEAADTTDRAPPRPPPKPDRLALTPTAVKSSRVLVPPSAKAAAAAGATPASPATPAAAASGGAKSKMTFGVASIGATGGGGAAAAGGDEPVNPDAPIVGSAPSASRNARRPTAVAEPVTRSPRNATSADDGASRLFTNPVGRGAGLLPPPPTSA